MNKLKNDINDDEIRIISSDKKLPVQTNNNSFASEEFKRKPVKWTFWLIIGAVILFGALVVFFWWEIKDDPEETDNINIESVYNNSVSSAAEKEENTNSSVAANVSEKGFVEIYDTTVNKIPLSIFIPKNSTPKLQLGIDALTDTTAVLVVQAADIRKDNGQILGSYVSEGKLLSHGESKAGFCAIINGKLTIGVADATSFLEQAIEKGGYFFRQYPLVVGGQRVDNKLNSSSLRKALAELNGETVVIMNDKQQTLNEFSQTLVDLGVSNAIYLIGSTAPGFAKDGHGNKIAFGKEVESPAENTNYLIWE